MGKWEKHGDRANGRRDRLYRIWDGMIGRCERESQKQYKYYGARGITVCDEWRKKYFAFKEWATQNGYSEKLSLDRIDNERGYSPENCRWVSFACQNNNRRNNVIVDVNGENMTLREASSVLGISYNTLMYRRHKSKAFDNILCPIKKKTTKSSCKNKNSTV